MKKTIRPLSLLLLLAALLSLCACGKKNQYRDDIPMDRLAKQLDSYLGADSLAEMNSGYLSGAMRLDPSMFANYCVKINSRGVNIDEYGLFLARDDDSVAGVKDAVEGYLKLRRDTWMEEYMPQEKPKLEQATVSVFGRYVLYLIVSDENRVAMRDAVDKTLRKD